MTSKELLESIIKECIKRNIYIYDVSLENDELAYTVNCAGIRADVLLYLDGDKVFCESRYNRIDEIKSFYDFVHISFDHAQETIHSGLHKSDVGCYWLDVFKEFDFVL